MRSSGSPGSWPPSAAELRCVPLTLHPQLKTSNLFPESGGMFMAANRAFLTSHAPARVRIGTPSPRAEASCPGPFPPGLLQPPRGPADPRQHPPLPPGRLDLLADPHPPIVPAAFRKLDAVAVLTGPSLPVPQIHAGAGWSVLDRSGLKVAWAGARSSRGVPVPGECRAELADVLVERGRQVPDAAAAAGGPAQRAGSPARAAPGLSAPGSGTALPAPSACLPGIRGVSALPGPRGGR